MLKFEKNKKLVSFDTELWRVKKKRLQLKKKLRNRGK